jgi:hypothetical protein
VVNTIGSDLLAVVLWPWLHLYLLVAVAFEGGRGWCVCVCVFRDGTPQKTDLSVSSPSGKGASSFRCSRIRVAVAGVR